jgi:nucleoside-diphosphate-sugar epimerase
MSVLDLPEGAQSGAPVVVTGGAGYIGSIVVRLLLESGRRVRVVDALLYGDDALHDVLDHPNLEMVVADFRDETRLRQALRGAAAVAHLGAIVGDPACAIDEDESLSTNVHAAELVADLCVELGIPRLVFASTCSVYGASADPLDETSALNPVSLYANTKIAAEEILLARASADFSPVILRFGTAFGVSHRFRFDLVVNLLTAKAMREGQITIHGGDQWRPFIHVHDIARSVVLALDAPAEQVSGEIINVGADELNYQLRQVGEIIQELVPTAEVVTSEQVTDKRNYYVRFGKARDLLGFAPTRNLEDGVRELVELLRSDEVGEHHEPRYHNVIALSEAFADRARIAGMASHTTTRRA